MAQDHRGAVPSVGTRVTPRDTGVGATIGLFAKTCENAEDDRLGLIRRGLLRQPQGASLQPGAAVDLSDRGPADKRPRRRAARGGEAFSASTTFSMGISSASLAGSPHRAPGRSAARTKRRILTTLSLPPTTSRSRLPAAVGKSGGRGSTRSGKYAWQRRPGCFSRFRRHPAEIAFSTSAIAASAPNFSARTASRYRPIRGQSRQAKRTTT